MTRTVYSDEAKREALELLREGDRSYGEVSAATGVPVGTLSGWAKRAGIVVVTAKPMDDQVEARKRRISVRRARLAEKLLKHSETLADRAVKLAEQEIVTDKGILLTGATDAKSLMTAAAIALDKFRLEMGEPTEVHRYDSRPAEKVRSKVDELAARRQQKTA